MTALNVLHRYCASGTAEGDAAFLEDAFVPPTDYADLIEPPAASPRILVGKKGGGKSAILNIIFAGCRTAGVPAVFLRPDDFDFSFPSGATDIATVKRVSYEGLIRAIAICLGTNMHGLISDSDARLFSEAVATGARRKDVIQRVLKPLASLGKLATAVEFEKFVPRTRAARSTKELAAAIERNLTKRGGRVFYLLIDDTDQFAAPNEANHLNRIWGFILAVRKLSEVTSAIRPIITMRSEFWTRLRSEDAGQRDQLDHFLPLAYLLSPTDSDIVRIVEKRLQLAKRELGLSTEGSPYDPFFDGGTVVLPKSRDERLWSSFIVKSARERPRDAIQFIGALATEAINSDRQKIDSTVAERAMVAYSTERKELLAIEYQHDCAQLGKVIEEFAALEWESSADDVRKFLLGLPGVGAIRVRGTNLAAGNPAHVFILWNLLYEAGFLNPKYPDAREQRIFRHVMFRTNPHLVSQAHWTDMQKAIWEIHPAYRSYLMKYKEDEQARILGKTILKEDAR